MSPNLILFALAALTILAALGVAVRLFGRAPALILAGSLLLATGAGFAVTALVLS